MNTLTSKKRNLQPLTIVIGLLCIALAVWYLFQTVLFIESKNIELKRDLIGVFSLIRKAFGYLSIVLNLLLLIWFIIMRNRLSKGILVTSVIGLLMILVISFLNRVVNHFSLIEGDGRTIYMYFTSAIGLVYNILIGAAFILMNRQFNDKLGKWALVIGILYVIGLVIGLSGSVISVVFPKHYPTSGYLSVLHKLNIGAGFIAVLRYIAMTIFFFVFVRIERGKITDK